MEKLVQVLEHPVSIGLQEAKSSRLRVSGIKLGYLGCMVVVEFDGYGALREMSKVSVKV